ncbi:MAG TPA: MBL fold metallo-hydrolase [Pirellulales bacterium]|jgi:glyoxylase-like metal-dependent hydrolase (beta-lactamase superfamily II)/ferredoxin|nr:MBL fold metallo-hydrolase [Pirellulales bacterium]
MANLSKRVPEDVAGDFFVDTTCIDCDTCRQLAPEVFAEAAETAFVRAQPQTSEQRRRALRALVSCPTGSIGCQAADDPKSVFDDFPLAVEGSVYYCGFNSPKSYGGNSYLVRRADGNWLIDSPKFLPQLVRSLEALGGIANIFLTHRDDVADAARYARHFGSRRFIHRAELASQPDAEQGLAGTAVESLAPGMVAIPTPGHTAGHIVLLVDDRFLFTGDHLHFDRGRQRLAASADYCWYSWPRQIESMRRLLDYSFEWILPGHGQSVHLPADVMRAQLAELVHRMRRVTAARSK